MIDVGAMPQGRCKYTFLLTEKGTIIDDLIVSEDTKEDASFLVVNASNREKDLEWIRKHAQGLRAEIHDATSELALIALQGPKSAECVRGVLGTDPGKLKYYTFDWFDVLGRRTMISRTGYTGEDGFEIYVPVDLARQTWDAFMKGGAAYGLRPIGLGARDTLRTEAGMGLYGNDIDDQTTPVEAGLTFAISEGVPFIGSDVIEKQKRDGVSKKLIGFHMDGKRIARHGMDVYAGATKTGVVTSGTWSPSLDRSIGMAHVRPEHANTPMEVDVRGKRERITPVPLPFYKRKK
jgi:glycine cleavage system T protein (aminomethyltransferase)